jgi:hypothetical protein
LPHDPARITLAAMKNTAFAAVTAALLIGGCGAPVARHEASQARNASLPAAAASPVPARADLSRFAGKYPFDPVDGKRFQDLPEVHAAIDAAVRDPGIREWIFTDKTGPSTPIAIKDGVLIAWGCEAHNCGPHNWSLVMKPDGTDPQLCYTDDSGIRWFAGGELLAKKDPCPSGDDD